MSRPAARALLLAAALLLGFALQGVRPLADPDEGRYAEVAREMLARGAFLEPQLYGHPHLTKPPVAYWSAALGMAVRGRDERGARAGVGLAFALWILAAAALGRALARSNGRDAAARETRGLWAGLVLGTTLLPFVGGSLLTADVFLAAACAAAAACFARALTDPAARVRALRCGWLVLGLGFLAKGPPVLVPLLGLAFAWPCRVAPARVARPVDAWGLAGFVALGLSWYAWLALRGAGVFGAIVQKELGRALFTRSLGRDGPFWMPLAVLLAGLLPWGLVLLPRVRALVARDAAWTADPVARLLLGWTCGGLAVFTLSPSRMPLYVLPLATGPCVAAGAVVARAAHGSGPRRASPRLRAAAWLVLVLAAAALFGVRAYGDRFAGYRHSKDLARAVAARAADGRPVLLLQARPAPGLAFYLGAVPRTVARSFEDALPHDLAAGDVPAFLGRDGRAAVAVRPETADPLAPGVLAGAPQADPRSGFSVLDLRPSP